MGGDSGSAGMNCLKENFDEVFALFADVLRKPAFAEDKLELAKVQAQHRHRPAQRRRERHHRP